MTRTRPRAWMGASVIRTQLTWFEHVIRSPPGHLSLKRSAPRRLGGDSGADPRLAAGIFCLIWPGNTSGCLRMDGWGDGWKGHGTISTKVLEDEEALMGNSNFSRSASARLLRSCEPAFKMRSDTLWRCWTWRCSRNESVLSWPTMPPNVPEICLQCFILIPRGGDKHTKA